MEVSQESKGPNFSSENSSDNQTTSSQLRPNILYHTIWSQNFDPERFSK